MFHQFNSRDDTPTIPSRPHNATACLECRRKKVNCSKEQPACRRCMAANNSATCYYPPVTPTFRSKPSATRGGLSKRRPPPLSTEVRTSAITLPSPTDYSSCADLATGGIPSPISSLSPAGDLSAVLDGFAFIGDAFHDADYSHSNLTDNMCVFLSSSNSLPVNDVPFQASPVFSIPALPSPSSAPQAQAVLTNTLPMTDAALPCISNESCQCNDIIATALGAEDNSDTRGEDSGDDEHEDDDASFRRLAQIRHSIEILRRLSGCSNCLSSRKSIMLLLVIVGRLVQRFQQLIGRMDSRSPWRSCTTIRVGTCFEANSPEELTAIFTALLRTHLQGTVDILSRLGPAIHDKGWTAQIDSLSAASVALMRMKTRLPH